MVIHQFGGYADLAFCLFLILAKDVAAVCCVFYLFFSNQVTFASLPAKRKRTNLGVEQKREVYIKTKIQEQIKVNLLVT